MKIKYAKTEANINQICQVLENHQVQLHEGYRTA